MIPAFQIEIPVAKSSSLAFPPSGIAGPPLAYSTQPSDHASPLGIRYQVTLDGTQDIVSVFARKLLQTPCEGR